MDKYCLVDYSSNKGGDYIYSTDDLTDFKDRVEDYRESNNTKCMLVTYIFDEIMNTYLRFKYKCK